MRLIVILLVVVLAVILISTLIGPARGWIQDPSPRGRKRFRLFVLFPLGVLIAAFLAVALLLDERAPPNSTYISPVATDRGIIPGHHATPDN